MSSAEYAHCDPGQSCIGCPLMNFHSTALKDWLDCFSEARAFQTFADLPI